MMNGVFSVISQSDVDSSIDTTSNAQAVRELKTVTSKDEGGPWGTQPATPQPMKTP